MCVYIVIMCVWVMYTSGHHSERTSLTVWRTTYYNPYHTYSTLLHPSPPCTPPFLSDEGLIPVWKPCRESSLDALLDGCGGGGGVRCWGEVGERFAPRATLEDAWSVGQTPRRSSMP